MLVNLDSLEEQIKKVVIEATKEALVLNTNGQGANEWMSMKEAASYIGVSYNSFVKFRSMGLAVCEIDGIKRVSKKEIDAFLMKNSF